MLNLAHKYMLPFFQNTDSEGEGTTGVFKRGSLGGKVKHIFAIGQQWSIFLRVILSIETKMLLSSNHQDFSHTQNQA